MCDPINTDIPPPRHAAINLNTCKKGQKLKDRHGDIYTYDKPEGGRVHLLMDDQHQSQTQRWDDGQVNAVIPGRYDIVEILPLETEKKVINLDTCKKGQKLRRRDGTIAEYDERSTVTDIHYIVSDMDRYPVFVNGRGNKGILPQEYINSDIVEILPLETVKPKIDLSTCKKGQKLLRRDGKIVTLGGHSNDGHIYQIRDGRYSNYVFTNGRGNSEDIPSRDHFNDIVEILPLEPEKPKIEEEIPILDKVSTVDDVEFQMWDKVNEEYYGVVSAEFARKLEDNNRKLITENTSLLNRIKQLEKELNQANDDKSQLIAGMEVLISALGDKYQNTVSAAKHMVREAKKSLKV